ncbi:unnamed protein product [Clonostachys rhizophaga]|uniref:Uncharacterized protein n=1 Tax=Clonostachys rhizophaga TaxID=160324 RepID=A0A9N9VGL1_9HYPO|nr:unnamed protein product [Clonostachys rhizophaga]
MALEYGQWRAVVGAFQTLAKAGDEDVQDSTGCFRAWAVMQHFSCSCPSVVGANRSRATARYILTVLEAKTYIKREWHGFVVDAVHMVTGKKYAKTGLYGNPIASMAPRVVESHWSIIATHRGTTRRIVALDMDAEWRRGERQREA